MKMKSLEHKPEEMKAGMPYYHSLTVKASEFPELHKMKNGEEAHVTVRLKKRGSRLHPSGEDSDMDFDMTHMGHEGMDDDEDNFPETIGYRHRVNKIY